MKLNLKKLYLISIFAACGFVFSTCRSSQGAGSARITDAEYREATQNSTDKISAKTYANDKKQITKLVGDLDRIVKSENFEEWQKYLSDDSRAFWTNKQNLAKITKKYRSRGIVLRSLEDYFTNFIVGARRDRKMGKIVYVSKNYIKVFEDNEEKNIIFYELIRDKSGNWKLKLRQL